MQWLAPVCGGQNVGMCVWLIVTIGTKYNKLSEMEEVVITITPEISMENGWICERRMQKEMRCGNN
eukprot:1156044-Pelagomonas_calceolata.AAC.7